MYNVHVYVHVYILYVHLMIWLSYVIALDTSCHCLLVLGGVDIVELLVDTGGVVVVTEAHDFVRDDCCLKPTEKMYMYMQGRLIIIN